MEVDERVAAMVEPTGTDDEATGQLLLHGLLTAHDHEPRVVRLDQLGLESSHTRSSRDSPVRTTHDGTTR